MAVREEKLINKLFYEGQDIYEFIKDNIVQGRVI